MTTPNTNPNLQVVSPCLDEPPPPPVPPPPPPPQEKPHNCVECSAVLKDSPARRSGPKGPGTLCNACGLRILKRKRAARGGIKKSPRRARQNTTARKRQSHSQNNNHTQPPLYPNPHPGSASTDIPVTQSSSPQHSRQPRVFNPVQSHASPTPDTRLSPSTSASTSLAPSPTIPCPQPAPGINPPNVDAIQPNIMPNASLPAHNSVPCSGPLHPHNAALVHHQTVAPSGRPVQSSADPIHLQLSAVAPPKNGHMMHAQSHQHGMAPLPNQYAEDAESASAEQMFNALHIGDPHATGETATQGSDNTIDQGDFSADVFGRCDSAGTTSTQLDLVEAFGMEMSQEQLPPGNGIIPVEGPYDDTVDPITMAMGSMPMTTPVSMAPTHFSGMMPVQSSPMSNVVMQSGDITSCIDSLTTLDQMNSRITQSVSSMDERLAQLVRKHEELTQARNEVLLSINQLQREKSAATKKQRQVCDHIARTTCLVQFLQKQEPYPTGA